jgi:hypothetical protein
VTSEHPLPVVGPLQRPQNVFEVAPHEPRVSVSPRGKANLLQLCQARQHVMILRFGISPVGIDRFSPDCEVARIVATISLNDSIEACEPKLLNLSALCLKSISLRPKPQFKGCQFFGVAANSRLYEFTGKPKRGPAVVKTTKGNVDVWMLSVVMYHGDPFQF